MKTEEKLQIAVSKYLRLQYPDVIFTAERMVYLLADQIIAEAS